MAKKSQYIYYFGLMLIFALASIKSTGDLFILDEEYFYYHKLPSYILLLQEYSNTIIIAIMAFLVLSKLTKETITFPNSFNILISFCVFQLIVSFSSNSDISLLKSLSVLIIFMFFSIVVQRLNFHSLDRLYSIPYSMLFGIGIFVISNIAVYFFLPNVSIYKGRFFGLSFHPNATGVSASICFALSLSLIYLERTSFKRMMIPLFFFITSFFLCFITDSRTAIGGCFVALAFIFFVQIKKAFNRLLFFILSVNASLFVFLLYFDGNFTTRDLGERGFNRDETWTELLNNALNPTLFGLGKLGATANSYLFAIVAGGVIGAVFFYLTIFKLLKSLKIGISSTRVLYTLLTVILLCVAVLEGFLLDTVSIPVFVFWILLTHYVKRTNYFLHSYV